MTRTPRRRVTVAAVRKVPARRISGVFWHQGAIGRPLRSFISPSPGDGRYHREGGAGAWYASSKERAAWVELFRHHTSTELSPLEVRRRVGKVEVRNVDVLDLTDPVVRDALGVDEDDLIDDDIGLCQEIAGAARSAGFSGILAPSASLSGEQTLVVFPTGMRKVREEHSRIQRPPRSIRRELNRVRVGSMRSLIRRWPRDGS